MTVVERNRVIGRYRSAPHNVLIGAALLLSGMLAVQVERNGSWTWRVPVLGALELVLLIRAGRRAVLVSDFGLKGRGLLVSWRAPWSSIESFGVGDARSEPTMAAPGRLTVTFRDGRVHCARLGRGRRHDPLFAAAVDEARRNHSPAPRWCRYENVPLVGFIVASLALVVVLAVNDNFRANKRADARLPVELSDPKAFDVEIWITGLLAVVLGAVALTTGVAALRQAMTAAPHAPSHSWAPDLVFPAQPVSPQTTPATGSLRPPVPLDHAPVLTVDGQGIRTTNGDLIAATSSRTVPWTPVIVTIYWLGPGVADHTVHLRPGTGGYRRSAVAEGRWTLTSWTAPLVATAEEIGAGPDELVLRDGEDVIGYVRPTRSDWSRCRVADTNGVTLATIMRSHRKWHCTFSIAATPTVRRLVLVATTWADARDDATSD